MGLEDTRSMTFCPSSLAPACRHCPAQPSPQSLRNAFSLFTLAAYPANWLTCLALLALFLYRMLYYVCLNPLHLSGLLQSHHHLEAFHDFLSPQSPFLPLSLSSTYCTICSIHTMMFGLCSDLIQQAPNMC